MTVLLDIETNLLVGHLFALSAWKETWGQQIEPFNARFGRAMAWSAGCFVPVAGYFYYAYPDWSWVYLTDPAAVPGWVGPCIFLGYASGMLYGFLTAQYLLSKRKLAAFAASAALAAFFNAAMFAATWDQYMHLGTMASYHAGHAKVIFEDSAFVLRMNVGGALMVGGAIAVLALNLFSGKGKSAPAT